MLAGCAASAAAAWGSPLLPLGRSAALVFDGSATMRYDDNVYLAGQGERDDLAAVLSPGLALEIGDRETSHGRVAAHENLVRFFDLTSENADLFAADAAGRLLGAQSSLDFDLHYEELQENTRDYREQSVLVRRDRTNGSLRALHAFSPRTSLSFGLTYIDDAFRDSRFLSTRQTALPLNLYYELTPKLDVSAGYRFRHYSIERIARLGFDEHFVNLGLRGDFSTKVHGEVRAGVARRNGGSGGDQNMFAVDGSMRWLATPKLTYGMTAARDFRASNATGESLSETSLGLTAEYAISNLWSASAGLRYEAVGYFGGRDDDFTVFDLGLRYRPDEMLELSAAYTRQDNRSNRAPLEFSRNIVSLSAGIRY